MAATTAFTTGHFRAAMTDADRRVAAQDHLDARSQRIYDYAASLEAALDAAPSASAAQILERRLTQARLDLAAARPQLAAVAPPSARSLAARSRQRRTEPGAEAGEPTADQAVAPPLTHSPT